MANRNSCRVGLRLTAVGSAYHHLAPDNQRLSWDRLPMTLAFMAVKKFIARQGRFPDPS